MSPWTIGRSGAGWALLATVALLPGAAKADVTDIRNANNAIELDGGATHLNYKEKADGGTLDSEKGWLSTAHLGVSYLALDQSPLTNLYLHLDVQGSTGSTRYGGALQDLQSGAAIPWQSSTNDNIVSTDVQIGYAFPIGSTLMLTPYGEIGYRYWDRDLKGDGGYPEHYSNWEGMGGLLAQYSPIARWVFSLSGSVGMTFGGNLDASGIQFRLGDDLTWRTQAKVGFRITTHLELLGTAAYERLGFGASPVYPIGPAIGLQEPDSTTHQATILVGIAYHFF